MSKTDFYNLLSYKNRQSAITKANWTAGVYDFRYKREMRQCIRPGCDNEFEVQLSDKKKFCSNSCSAKVNNLNRSKFNGSIKKEIENLYKKGLSMQEISDKTGWKYANIVYWMQRYNIPRRSRSEATYVKRNPDGDPFHIRPIINKEQSQLFALGVGLYLGEGDKRTSCAVKLGNADPDILKLFLRFLKEICGAKEAKIKAEINIFNDVDVNKAIKFWLTSLGLKRAQLRTVTIREPRGDGSYRHKSKYGTFTICFENTKLKSIVNKWCQEAVCRA